MNNAMITVGKSNERRMTREQCETLCDNIANEFNITLCIEQMRATRIELQRTNYDEMKHNGGCTTQSVLIRAVSYTSLYWAMVDMREMWHDFQRMMRDTENV
jgi:hypothetical protein